MINTRMINIAIAGKSGQDRESIVKTLNEQDDFNISCIDDNNYDVVKLAQKQQPDIIIMDYDMNNEDNYNLASVIKLYSPATELIVLYSPNECDAVNYAFRAGISGCLPRQEVPGKIVKTVRGVYYGGMCFGGVIKNNLRNSLILQEKIDEIGYYLKKTEIKIICGIAKGLSDKEIAHKLEMTEGAVRNCVNHIKKKTGLHRTQMPIYAMLSGIINPANVKEQIKASLKKKE